MGISFTVLFPVSAVSVVLFACIIVNLTYAQGNNSNFFLKDSSPYGIPFKQWIGKWWQWYTSVPKNESPNWPDYKGTTDCPLFSQNSSSPVFFVMTPSVDDPNVERTCKIPKDKALLIPIMTGEADTGDPEQTDKTDQGLISTATAGHDFADIQVKLDGSDLAFNEDKNYRATSNFFNITLPEHNIWEDKEQPGTYRGVAEGYFLLLKPLSSGNHEFSFNVKADPPNPNPYSQIVTYNFVVE